MDRPFAPGRDDPQARRDGFVGQLEAHLVVALARAAVREAVRAELERELRLPLRQHRPRHRSAQQILVLIDGSGAQRRPDVLAHKLYAQVFDVRRRSARGQRFLSRRFEVFLLADVADHGDDLAPVVFRQPGNDDGGIKPSGIRQDNFLRLAHVTSLVSTMAPTRHELAGGRQSTSAPSTRQPPYEFGCGECRSNLSCLDRSAAMECSGRNKTQVFVRREKLERYEPASPSLCMNRWEDRLWR